MAGFYAVADAPVLAKYDSSMKAEYSARADALYVSVCDAEAARTRRLDDLRMVDYAADGGVVGIEFVGASAGVDLKGIGVSAVEIEQAIRSAGLNLRVYV